MCHIQLISTPASDKNSPSNILINEILKALPFKFRTEVKLSRFISAIQPYTSGINQCNKTRKKLKYNVGKGRDKFVIMYICN